MAIESLRDQPSQQRYLKRPWENQDYPPKKTWSGKVHYQRKKHYFTRKDVERIVRNTLEDWEKGGSREDEVPWLISLVDRISIFLLGKIVAKAGLGDKFTNILFYWVSANAQRLALAMGDPTGAQLEAVYRARLTNAWNEYTENNNRSLFDAMLQDILTED